VPEYGPVKLDATIPEGLKAGETFQVGVSMFTSVSVLVSVSMCLCKRKSLRLREVLRWV